MEKLESSVILCLVVTEVCLLLCMLQMSWIWHCFALEVFGVVLRRIGLSIKLQTSYKLEWDIFFSGVKENSVYSHQHIKIFLTNFAGVF